MGTLVAGAVEPLDTLVVLMESEMNQSHKVRGHVFVAWNRQ